MVPPSVDSKSSNQRVAVITGASSGIGREVALHCAKNGMYLVLVARRANELKKTLDLCIAASPEAAGRILEADLSTEAGATLVAQSVKQHEGRCDALINNAGAGAYLPVDDESYVALWRSRVQLNVTTPIDLTVQLLQLLHMGDNPVVVNISSIAGLISLPTASLYCATKHALTAWSSAMHGDLARYGIKVVGVHPGPLVTEGWPQARVVNSTLGRFAMTDVNRVARVVARAATGRGRTSNRAVIVIPWKYNVARMLQLIMGNTFRRVLKNWARKRTLGSDNAEFAVTQELTEQSTKITTDR